MANQNLNVLLLSVVVLACGPSAQDLLHNPETPLQDRVLQDWAARTAEQSNDGQAAILLAQGRQLFDTGLYPLAADRLERARVLAPDSPAAAFWLGCTRQKWGRSLLDHTQAQSHFRLAEEAWLSALKLKPDFARARRHLALLYVQDRKLPAAAGPHLDYLLATGTPTARLLSLRASVHLDQNQTGAASRLYEFLAVNATEDSILQDARNHLRFLKGASL